MNRLVTTAILATLASTTAVAAEDDDRAYPENTYRSIHAAYEYARVLRVRPIYRRIEVSEPVQECRQEPIYHTRHRQSDSVGGMLAGGLIGGIIGHQIGNGRGQKIATAMGTLVGAQIGREAASGDPAHDHSQTVSYAEHCRTRHRLSYEKVLDGYNVTYRFRGQRYRVEMPYKPAKRIKMRVEFTPVI